MAGPMKTYGEKLKDPRWQRKRLEIMQRDNFTCQFCGSKEDSLQVHHLMYAESGAPWDAADEFLITICEPCHATEHATADGARKFLAVALAQVGLGAEGLCWLAQIIRSVYKVHNHPKSHFQHGILEAFAEEKKVYETTAGAGSAEAALARHFKAINW